VQNRGSISVNRDSIFPEAKLPKLHPISWLDFSKS